jgi:hypothetical protein
MPENMNIELLTMILILLLANLLGFFGGNFNAEGADRAENAEMHMKISAMFCFIRIIRIEKI